MGVAAASIRQRWSSQFLSFALALSQAWSPCRFMLFPPSAGEVLAIWTRNRNFLPGEASSFLRSSLPFRPNCVCNTGGRTPCRDLSLQPFTTEQTCCPHRSSPFQAWCLAADSDVADIDTPRALSASSEFPPPAFVCSPSLSSPWRSFVFFHRVSEAFASKSVLGRGPHGLRSPPWPLPSGTPGLCAPYAHLLACPLSGLYHASWSVAGCPLPRISISKRLADGRLAPVLSLPF